MEPQISEILNDFLREKRLVAEVARRIGKHPSTLASELSPAVGQAKFGLDDFPAMCAAIRELGLGSALDGILIRYIESLRGEAAEPPSNEELLPLVSTLMEKTGSLANSVIKLLNTAEEQDLRQAASIIRSYLVPTTLRLGALIENRLGRQPGLEGPHLQTQTDT